MIKKYQLSIAVTLLSICTSVQAQPLMLEQLFDSASATYPSLVAARLEARASIEDVTAAERLRWPTIAATLESNSGNLRSTPSRGIQVDQTVWDFGRNTAKISESQALAEISSLKIVLQKQEIYLQMTGSWQNMIAAYERLKIAQLTLDRLKAYQAQMLRRVDAEASPRIDRELVDARMLQTEVELTTAQTSLQVALSRLEQFSGESNLLARIQQAQYVTGLGDTEQFAKQLQNIDWRTIANDHPLSAKARTEVTQMKKRLDAKAAEGFPQVFVRVYKPIGTIPSSSDTSTTAFLGVRYSPGAGFSTLAEARALATRVDSVEQSVESTTREIQQTLQNDREEFANARTRIAALEKSVASSVLVLESYQRQFKIGRKQWQDLLNQVRELAQNQYALADAQASMVGAMGRLQIRMGQVSR